MQPFYAGAMHYWRVDPDAWAPCLRAMHDVGLTLVSTPVPWRVHEPARSEHAWTGERDLVRFIRAAREAGLGIVLAPGPCAGAELTSFGVPDWVLAEPACRALTSRGTAAWLPSPPRAFPIPSLASAAFLAHVREWYAAVAKVIEPVRADVAAIAVERASFYRTGAYDLDYHPDAIAWFGEPPPRAWDPANAEVCVRWVQFRETYAQRALAAQAALLDEVGLGEIPRVERPPVSYAARAGFAELRAADIAHAGVGFVPWLPPPDDDPTLDRDRVLALLAAGARGFELAMAVERDRYVGAAIDRAGHVQATWIAPLVAAVAEVEWPTLRRITPIAVIAQRADERFGLASCLVEPMTPVLAELLGLGPAGAAELGSDAGAIAARRWHVAVCRALELAHVPYAVVDEHAELSSYRAVIAPTIERCDRALWARLRELAEARRTVVVIGPGTPARDEYDRPLDGVARRMGRLEPGSLEDLAGLAADLGALVDEVSWQVERPSGVRTIVFADASNAARMIFAFTDSRRPVTATLLADPATTQLRDVLTGECMIVRDGRVIVVIAGASVLRPEP